MKDKHIFLLILALFGAFYFMPVDSPLFSEAVLNGFELLHEYATQHVLTCLVPAFFIAGAISVFMKKDVIMEYLGNRGRRTISYPIASVSGSVLAVCSCTILPLFAGIRSRGAGLGPATTFLFSGPAINIAAVFLTISVLGVEIGIARIVFAVFLAILVGLSMELIFRERSQEGKLYYQQEEGVDAGKPVLLAFFLSMVAIIVVGGLQIGVLKYGLMVALVLLIALIAFTSFDREKNKSWLGETWYFTKLLIPYLFIGVFVAGFITPLLPQSVIEDVVGSNTVTGNLIASVLGAFMYFSTLTEIPILQAFIAKGMSKGPALALLLAGPSLSLPNMLVVRKVLGNERTAVYVVLVVTYSTIAGLIFGSL